MLLSPTTAEYQNDSHAVLSSGHEIYYTLHKDTAGNDVHVYYRIIMRIDNSIFGTVEEDCGIYLADQLERHVNSVNDERKSVLWTSIPSRRVVIKKSSLDRYMRERLTKNEDVIKVRRSKS